MVLDARNNVVNAVPESYEKMELQGKIREMIAKMENNPAIEKVYVIQSFTDPTKKYIISKMKNGKWACSCPMYRFNIPKGRYLHKAYRLPNGQLVCKHVAFVFQHEHSLVAVIDRGAGKHRRGVKEYAVNVVDWDVADARIRTFKAPDSLKVENEEKMEDIPIFAEDYARLGIELKPKEKSRGKGMGLSL